MTHKTGVRASDEVSNGQIVVVAFFIVLIFATSQFNTDMLHPPYKPRLLDQGIETKDVGLLGRRLALPVLAAVASVWLYLREKRPLRAQGLLGILLLAALVWSLASVGWAIEPSLAARKMVVLICMWIGAVWVATLVPLNRMPEFTALTVLPFWALCVGGDVLSGTFQPLSGGYRFAGFFHPNTNGQYLAFGVLASAVLAITSRRRVLPILCLVAFSCFLYLTRSRTSLFGVLVGLSATGLLTSVFAGLSSRRAAFRLIMVAGILIIIACTAYIIAGDRMTHGIADWMLMGRDPSELGTLTNRTLAWRELLERYISQRPLTGFGYGAFWTTKHMVAMSLLDPHGVAFQSHSGYLELLLSVGIIGTALHVGYTTVAALTAVRRYIRSPDIGSAFAFGSLVMFLTLIFTETLNFDVALPAFVSMVVIARFALVPDTQRAFLLETVSGRVPAPSFR